MELPCVKENISLEKKIYDSSRIFINKAINSLVIHVLMNYLRVCVCVCVYLCVHIINLVQCIDADVCKYRTQISS